jgi:hypothetical protein
MATAEYIHGLRLECDWLVADGERAPRIIMTALGDSVAGIDLELVDMVINTPRMLVGVSDTDGTICGTLLLMLLNTGGALTVSPQLMKLWKKRKRK